MKKIRVVALLGLMVAACQSDDGGSTQEDPLTMPTSPEATAPVAPPDASGTASDAPKPSVPSSQTEPTTMSPSGVNVPPTPVMTMPSNTMPNPVQTPPVTPSTSGEPTPASGGMPGTGGTPGGGGSPTAGGAPSDGGSPAVVAGAGGGQSEAGAGGAPPAEDPGAEYFTDWPEGTDPAMVGLKLARLFNSQSSDGTRHYKEACAWYGALQLAVLLDDTELLASLKQRYEPYKNAYGSLLASAGSVDENVWGIVPLELSLHFEDAVYLQDGTAIADHQQANINTQIRNAIDDMFMITGLQMQAHRATMDDKYLDLGAQTMQSYIANLQQSDGLFYQLKPNDSAKWSRGNGWFAAGMAEALRQLPTDHPNYQAVKAGYDKMMAALLEVRIPSGQGAGLWKQVLDYDGQENWAETSGSAMFTTALITGVRNGWLDAATYGPVAREAWIALVGYLEPDGRLRGVSDWMYGGSIQEYTSRATVTGDNHGQAPMMWSAAALLR